MPSAAGVAGTMQYYHSLLPTSFRLFYWAERIEETLFSNRLDLMKGSPELSRRCAGVRTVPPATTPSQTGWLS